MTELELYKFITDNEIEWHRNTNNGKPDIIIFVYTFQVRDFNKLLPNSILDNEGITCHMKDDYFAFWMNDICEYCGIDIDNVFKGEEY